MFICFVRPLGYLAICLAILCVFLSFGLLIRQFIYIYIYLLSYVFYRGSIGHPYPLLFFLPLLMKQDRKGRPAAPRRPRPPSPGSAHGVLCR